MLAPTSGKSETNFAERGGGQVGTPAWVAGTVAGAMGHPGTSKLAGVAAHPRPFPRVCSRRGCTPGAAAAARPGSRPQVGRRTAATRPRPQLQHRQRRWAAPGPLLPGPAARRGLPGATAGALHSPRPLRSPVGTPTGSPAPGPAPTHSDPKYRDPRGHPVPAPGPAYRAGEAAAAAACSPGPRGAGRPGRARRRERSRLLPAAPAPAPGAWFLLRARGLPERDFWGKKEKRPKALK